MQSTNSYIVVAPPKLTFQVLSHIKDLQFYRRAHSEADETNNCTFLLRHSRIVYLNVTHVYLYLGES